MKTIFLAAGRSSRMEPVSDKLFLEFCGKPLMIHLLENAKTGGCENFIIVANKGNHEEIATQLQQWSFSAEICLQSDLDDGMAGGVLAGLETLEDDEALFVVNGNDWVRPEAFANVRKKSAEFSGGILAAQVSEYFPGGYLEIDPKNVIQSIVEKPGEGSEPSDLVNIVVHYFKSSQKLAEALSQAESEKDDVYEQALQQLFSAEKFVAVPYADEWQAIKYPWHVLDMQALIMSQTEAFTDPSAEISDTVHLIGNNIFIDSGVKIMNGATIVGPCFIGKNSIIGQNCLIRGSNIGANCTIGFSTEISRSFLGRNVSTHHTYIGDSVIGDNVNCAAFSVTTNLRLDKNTVKMKIKDRLVDSKRTKLGTVIGNGAQIGSGAKIMPGRKIAAQELVGPNEVVK